MLLVNTAHKCSYFKISVSVRIRTLYDSLSLKFWKLESFSEARLSLEYTNQILLWNILFLNCALRYRFIAWGFLTI